MSDRPFARPGARSWGLDAGVLLTVPPLRTEPRESADLTAPAEAVGSR